VRREGVAMWEVNAGERSDVDAGAACAVRGGDESERGCAPKKPDPGVSVMLATPCRYSEVPPVFLVLCSPKG